MENSTIRLRSDEVDLSDKKIGEICEIKIQGKMKGMEERKEMEDMPTALGEKSSGKPKKYIEYTVEVQKAKEELGRGFFAKDKNVGPMATK